jgi:hypothetical protein
MLHMVYGHSFLLDSSANYESFGHPYLMLYHSDITTLVLFALVLVRLLAAAWFGLNHLLTVSGVLLAIWQSTCAGKTVRSVVLAALMLDTKSHSTSGFCNVLDLSEKDAHRRIKLVVSSEKGGAGGA